MIERFRLLPRSHRGVERGSARCLFPRRFLVLILCHERAEFLDREALLQTEAVLTEIQNRLDPHPALPQDDQGRE